ncbi:ABC-type transport auxiliary lipoprotein family protein [Kordiimonas sp.]|uniref:ABC-type transport auxiliary lipoprotein family protein n=1 Tax=Kordiimonas sp. TaxID=1970157 RepID=UPI003A915DDB
MSRPFTLRPRAVSGFALAATLALSACGPIISFGDDGPGDSEYSLQYSGDYRSSGDDAPVIYVDEPHMADGLAGQKITVVLPGNKRSSLKGARWSAPLSTLVRDYVARALGDKAGAHMIGEGGLDIHAGCRLGTKVWALEFVPGGNAQADKVEVAMELSLVRLSDSMLVSHPTFTASAPVRGAEGDAVAGAFRAAMADVADDMGRWLKAQVSTCEIAAK